MLFINHFSIISILNSMQDALSNPRWKVSMDKEMKSKWELVDPPKEKKRVGCQWIYTMKQNLMIQ